MTSVYQTTTIQHRFIFLFSTLTVLLTHTSVGNAGAYIFAGETNGIDIVTHPTPYLGSGGVVTVGICIDPASANATDMELSVENIVSTINGLQPTTGNLSFGGSNNIPTGFLDFESVALHEVGHCIGMAHVNAASESGLPSSQWNYTKATDGANNQFDVNPGPDNIIGSSDDIRGDDVNLHWFQKFINNPFTIGSIVDSTTYSINLADLPQPHTFAANADRQVAELLGFPNTEAVMQQGTAADEAQRTLTPDDVATLRYGMSGVDEIQSTADDYTINLEYRGITTSNCDIVLKIDAIAGLAYCQTTGSTISPGHMRITSANIFFGDSYNWFFNDVVNIPDTTPDPFAFTDQVDVALSTIIVSDIITVSGINTATTISINSGEYSVNGGDFITTTGTVSNNDTVRVRHVSSSSFSTVTNTTLNIGGVTDTFTSTTEVQDTTPDSFTFTDQVDVPRTTTIISNSIIVSGINDSAPISVSGGEYSINGSVFTALTGTVNNNDTVRVRHVSSSNFSTSTNTTLNIGGVTDTFTSTTEVQDTTPDSFNFTDQVDVPRTTTIISNSIIVSGINDAAPISVNGGEYSVNGAGYTSVSGVVSNNDTVQVRHVSSSSFSTTTATTLTIGGVSDTFTSTTEAQDTTPNLFSFSDQVDVPLATTILSNVITITGINDAAPVTISGGEYSVDGGAFTTVTGTVSNNQTVRVRHISSSNVSTAVNTTINIGGVTDVFSSTTVAADTTPDNFSFVDQVGVALNSTVTSNSINITGINTATPISVSGGEYSINNGTYTAIAGTVSEGSTVRVRHISSANALTSVSTTLTIGGISATFTSTTNLPDSTPDVFSFIDQFNVPLNSQVLSDPIVVSGINVDVSISVTTGEYSINGGAFTASPGVVRNADTVVVRHTSAPLFSTEISTMVTIGGISDTFTSTTVAVNTTPEVFVLEDQFDVPLNTVVVSNSIAVTRINTAAPISVTGGEYSVNGNAFTSISGTINSGDTVVVRHTSSSNYSTTVNTVLTIGGTSDTFSSTTVASPNGGGNSSGGGGSLGIPILLLFLAGLICKIHRRKPCDFD